MSHRSTLSSGGSSSSSSSSSSVSLGSVPRFNGSAGEWPEFKFVMLAALRYQRVLDTVLAPHPRQVRAMAVLAAAGPASEAEQKSEAVLVAEGAVQSAADQQWEERADKAYCLLVLSLGTSSLTALARGCPQGDAYAVWQLLLGRYERKTVASQAAVFERLMAVRMEPGEAVDCFVARLKNFVLALAEMGEQTTETMQKHLLLKGLPPSFESIKQTLGLRDGKATFDEIVSHLVDYQENSIIQERATMQQQQEVASYAYAPGEGNAGGRSGQQHRRGGGRGGFGGGAGRYNHQGAGSNGSHSNGSSGSADVRACFTCDRTGHLSFDCPQNVNAKKCSFCRCLGHVPNQCPRRASGRGPRNGAGNGNNNGRGGGQRQQQAHANSPAGGQQSASAMAADEYSDGDDAVFFADADSTSAVVSDPVSTGGAAEAPVAAAAMAASDSRAQGATMTILDSGASRHLWRDEAMLTNQQALDVPIQLRLADGSTMQLKQGGVVNLRTTVPASSSSSGAPKSRLIILTDVAYHPGLHCNLISVSRIVKAGYDVSFEETHATVRHKGTQRVVLVVPRQGQLYVLQTSLPPLNSDATRTPAESVFMAPQEAAAPMAALPAVVVAHASSVGVPLATPAVVVSRKTRGPARQ